MKRLFRPLLFLAVALAASLAGADELELLARTHYRLALNDPLTLQLMSARQRIVVGVVRPDFRPFDITTDGRAYEGLSADYLAIVKDTLGVEVKIRPFDSLKDAFAALSGREIDLLSTITPEQVAGHRARLSDAYSQDSPHLFNRTNELRQLDRLVGVSIAMRAGYLPPDQAKQLFPGANLHFFKTDEQAIAAVAFGNLDLYFGNSLSAGYVINRSYYNYIRPLAYRIPPLRGIGFAVRDDDGLLLHAINAVLAGITEDRREEIARRWIGGVDFGADTQLHLTSLQTNWLARHPSIVFGAVEDLPPISFYDEYGRYSGLVADLLNIATSQTGIRFELRRHAQTSEMTQDLATGKTQLVVTSPTSHIPGLHYTHPFVAGAYVYIGRTDGDSDGSTPRRLALSRGHPLESFFHTRHPDLQLVGTDSLRESLRAVAVGDADLTVAGITTAQYLLNVLNSPNLRIGGLVDAPDALLAFASPDPTLIGVLDQVLLQVPPNEINTLATRWRTNAAQTETTWQRYKPLFLQMLIASAAFLALTLLWAIYLRRQIRQRERAEAALAEQLAFKQSLINGIPQPVYVRDRNGNLLSCNDKLLELTQMSREQVIGQPTRAITTLPAEEQRMLEREYEQVIASGAAQESDRELHVNGAVHHLFHWIHPYRNAEGEIRGIIGGLIDISERLRLVDALRSAKEQADQASRVKSTFLATMSHEIRTPMNAIIGMLELALRKLDAGQTDRKAIEVAYDSSHGLLELIGDILDISKIEAGNMTLKPAAEHLGELILSVVRVFDGLTKQKGLQLDLALDDSVRRCVSVDALRFKQVLSNLLSNAIKFTDEGSVGISASTRPAGQDAILLHLSVRDSGIGISAADQDRLFAPFTQVVAPGHAARGGTGLGLSICRSISEMMGGQLYLESTLGEGTVVHLELPLPLATDAQIEATAAPQASLRTGPARPLRVLVVDDHPTNRLLVTQQLQHMGHSLLEAEDGYAALAVLDGAAVDLIITDCNMPNLNGYDLARQVRAREAETGTPRCPIVAYTANAQQEEIEKCLAAGMDACLFKPLSLDDLQDCLARLFPAEPSPPSPAPKPAFANYDAELMRALVQSMVQTSRADLLALQARIEQRDLPAISDLAHRIKGPAQMIAASTIVECCEALERESRSETPSFDTVEDSFRQLREALQALESSVGN